MLSKYCIELSDWNSPLRGLLFLDYRAVVNAFNFVIRISISELSMSLWVTKRRGLLGEIIILSAFNWLARCSRSIDGDTLANTIFVWTCSVFTSNPSTKEHFCFIKWGYISWIERKEGAGGWYAYVRKGGKAHFITRVKQEDVHRQKWASLQLPPKK